MVYSEHLDQPSSASTAEVRLDWLFISNRSDADETHLPAETFINDREFFLDDRILHPFPERHPVIADLYIPVPVNFKGGEKIFDCGVSFINVVFEKEVDFSSCLFNGPAYFWGCTFKAGMNLSKAQVKRNNKEIHRRDPGEVNFSYCHFNGRFVCDRTVFNGFGYLHRTIFCKGASFTGSKFEKPFQFESSSSDICVPKDDLKDGVVDVSHTGVFKAICEYMENEGITRNCVDWDAYINFDPYILSTKGLKNRLRHFKEGGEEEAGRAIAAVCRCWNKRYLHTMFSDPYINIDRIDLDKEVSSHTFEKVHNVKSESKNSLTDFRGAQFAKGTAFRNVDLGYCLFSGSNVSDVDFVVSYWARQRCNPKIHKVFHLLTRTGLIFSTQRQALRDELELDRRQEEEHFPEEELSERRLELSELYREMRIAYVKEGDTLIGRDFFYGETEMYRLAKSLPRRVFSLSFLYKALAGYSRQEGLAFLWLLVLLVLFPILYYGINDAEFSILKTATTQSDLQRAQDPARPVKHDSCLVVDADDRNVLDNAQEAAGSGNIARSLSEAVRQGFEAANFLTSKKDESVITQAGKVLDENCIGSGEFTELPLDLEVSLAGWESVRHVLASSERLLVFAQIGLIFICLRARFQRIT